MKKAALASATVTTTMIAIIGAAYYGLVTIPVALLLFIALVGICVGVGILVAAWRLTGELD